MPLPSKQKPAHKRVSHLTSSTTKLWSERQSDGDAMLRQSCACVTRRNGEGMHLRDMVINIVHVRGSRGARFPHSGDAADREYDALNARNTLLSVHVSENKSLPLLGHKLTMVVILQDHSGIPTVLHVSRGGAVTHIVHIVWQGAMRHRHKLFTDWAQVNSVPVWPHQDYS